MKSKVLPILVSNLIVAVLAWCAASFFAGGDADALAAKDAEIRALKDELAKRAARSPRGNDARRSVAAAPRENAADAADPETTEARRKERERRFETFRKIRRDTAVTRLAMRLNLNEEQKAQLAARAEEHEAALRELAERVRSEPDNEALRAELRERMRAADPEEVVAELLGGEQLEEYEAYRRERATARAETVANMRLAMLQESVALSQEQKDRYFSEYATAALETDGRVSSESEREILKNVLTNEQFSVYEDQQATLEAAGVGRGGMRGGMRGMRDGGNPPPPPRE
ncbi:MAG: hypothetical protein ACI4QA_07610 [Candidatus Spyradosoma sp.]